MTPSDLEALAFASGAQLARFERVLMRAKLPRALLGERCALQAAQAALRLEGRRDTFTDIRDAVCLTRPEAAPGPAGEMFLRWRKLGRLDPGSADWHTGVAPLLPATVAEALAQFELPQGGSPAAQAASWMKQVLRRFPREMTAACLLADLALARAMGWSQPLPLLAVQMSRRSLQTVAAGTQDPLYPVHVALIAGCRATAPVADDLSRRAARLQAVAPRLRSRGAEAALSLFLSRDAIAPAGMLSPRVRGTAVSMSDRAARRLCDRLVALGAVRELTGRSSFRFYGL